MKVLSLVLIKTYHIHFHIKLKLNLHSIKKKHFSKYFEYISSYDQKTLNNYHHIQKYLC